MNSRGTTWALLIILVLVMLFATGRLKRILGAVFG